MCTSRRFNLYDLYDCRYKNKFLFIKEDITIYAIIIIESEYFIQLLIHSKIKSFLKAYEII